MYGRKDMKQTWKRKTREESMKRMSKKNDNEKEGKVVEGMNREEEGNEKKVMLEAYKGNVWEREQCHWRKAMKGNEWVSDISYKAKVNPRERRKLPKKKKSYVKAMKVNVNKKHKTNLGKKERNVKEMGM